MSCTCDKNKNKALTLKEIEQPFCQQFFPIVKEGGFEVLDTDDNGEVDEFEIVGALRLGIVKSRNAVLQAIWSLLKQTDTQNIPNMNLNKKHITRQNKALIHHCKLLIPTNQYCQL